MFGFQQLDVYRCAVTFLRFAVFDLPARLVSHARRLLARVARSLLERPDVLVGRARLRIAHAA